MSPEAIKAASATNVSSPSGSAAPGTSVVAVSPGRSLVPLLAGMAVLTILGGGGSAWFVMNRVRSTEAVHAATSSPPKYILHLEGFTVNLADPEETHFLRATIDLGVDHLPDGNDKERLAALPVPRIRDAILSVLTVGKADVLLTADGKAQLKKNLIDALNQNVPELGVREVYFSEFLVQR